MRKVRKHRAIARYTIAALVSAALLAVSLNALPAQGDTPDASSQDRAGALHFLPGHLIGKDYEPDKWYVRQGEGEWEQTYTPGWQGEGFSEQVRGQLLNLRSANGIFDDESGAVHDYDPDFDAQTNTDEFIANLPDYRAHGLMATDVNLQGGNPAYEGAVNPAFESDGTLRQEWKDRMGKVIEAHAEQNMAVVLGYFYFRQDDVLADDDAVRNAVTNTTDWLIEKNYRNVIIEIANEHNDSDYPDIISSDEGMAELIKLAQSRFDNADFRLAVSASRWGDGSWGDDGVADSPATGEAADLAMIHCNDKNAEECSGKAAEHQENYDYPIVLNETDNANGEWTEDSLNEDNKTIDAMVATGASWGLMHDQWNQYVACEYSDDCGSTKFDWELGSDPGANGSGEELLRNYAAGVFEHMKSVVFDSSTVEK